MYPNDIPGKYELNSIYFVEVILKQQKLTICKICKFSSRDEFMINDI